MSLTDPYIDPETGILKNLRGIDTWPELTKAESELSSIRAAQLEERGCPPLQGTLTDLQKIHNFLFQEIYEWAGQIRTVEIWKQGAHGHMFLPCARIYDATSWAYQELCNDQHFKHMEPRDIPKRLAYHYDNYNYIHPFREGNGRTSRIMWTNILRQAGYEISWEKLSSQENNHACMIAKEQSDLSELETMFTKILTPIKARKPANLIVPPGARLRRNPSSLEI